ncbi:hypothetical protein Haur_1370 [Herpetosiphon aurantiacus DSM 785]|uniref:Uncharacterized protein n=1 Tax=Herpetosiphon aurantiacus (strain ATCC 23779 / DSM 785 / 114-95) TaxID=316274 RepID=A9B2H0_HERA2|nr:hypothetical protein Haur_1370 [Herpetosiphon aurantiacus DSM 785]
MYAVYSIPPHELYEETVLELLPSYLRRMHNEREQQAMLIATKVGTMLFGDDTKGKGKSKRKQKQGSTTQPASTRSEVTYVSASQLIANMKARSVRP